MRRHLFFHILLCTVLLLCASGSALAEEGGMAASDVFIHVPKTTDKDFEYNRIEAYSEIAIGSVFYAYPLADKAYIYCADEGRTYYSDCWFEVNGKIVRKDQINEFIEEADRSIYNTSEERQQGLLKSISDGMYAIQYFYTYYREPVPTEVKVIVDFNEGSLEVEYSYTDVEKREKQPAIVCDEWMNEIVKEHSSIKYRQQASVRRKSANILKLWM